MMVGITMGARKMDSNTAFARLLDFQNHRLIIVPSHTGDTHTDHSNAHAQQQEEVNSAL